MPRRRRHAKRIVREFGVLELLELRHGPFADGSLFDSDDERLEVYEANRAHVLGRADHRSGWRPWAWWVYEAPDDAPHPDDYPDDRPTRGQHSLAGLEWLAERGLLDQREVAYLLSAPHDPAVSPYAREIAAEWADALLAGLARQTENDHQEVKQ